MLRFLPALMFSVLFPFMSMAQGAQVAFGADQQDPSAPIEVTADALSVNQTDGTAIYTGNVLVSQGDMRMAAARVLVVYAEEQSAIDRIEATGGVTLVSGEEAAEADRADYSLADSTVVMSGDVLLTQGSNALTSERMVINLESGTAQLTGRVRTVLQPQDSQTGDQ